MSSNVHFSCYLYYNFYSERARYGRQATPAPLWVVGLTFELTPTLAVSSFWEYERLLGWISVPPGFSCSHCRELVCVPSGSELCILCHLPSQSRACLLSHTGVACTILCLCSPDRNESRCCYHGFLSYAPLVDTVIIFSLLCKIAQVLMCLQWIIVK